MEKARVDLDYSKLSDSELEALALGKTDAATLKRRARYTPDIIDRQAAAIADQPSPFERFGAGVADVTEGVTQKFLNWTNPAKADAFTAEKNAERQAFEGARQNAAIAETGEEAGIDWWRAGGTGAALAPLALVPGGQGALARTGVGALMGSGTGYSLFDPENTTTSNLMRTGGGTVLGGAVSFAAPYAINALARGAQGVGNLARRGINTVRGAFTPETTITNNLRVQLSAQGVNFDSLSKNTQAAIIADAKETLRAGGKLSAEQLLRKADIERIAGPGSATKAQLTRNPADWTIERNLQKTEVNLPSVKTGAQETITGRLTKQNDALTEFAGGIGPRASATTPLEASSRAIGAVQARDRAAGEAVSELYEQFRNSGLKDAPVGEKHLTKALTDIIEDFGDESVIPGPVLARLKALGFLGGERSRFLTVQNSDTLKRVIDNNMTATGPFASGAERTAANAMSRLKDGLTKDLLDVPADAIGGSKMLLAARKAAAERFAARDAGRGVKQALMDAAPDRFMEQNVLGGSVRDLQALRAELASGPNPGAWDDLRYAAWQSIVDKVTSNGRAPFSSARLERELTKLGKERLETLFTGKELQKLAVLRRGAHSMTQEPLFSAPNRSNTAPTMMGQLLRAGNRIPLMGNLTAPIQAELETTATQGLLTQALSGSQSARFAQQQAQQAASRAVLERLLTQQTSAGSLMGIAPAASYMGQRQ